MFFPTLRSLLVSLWSACIAGAVVVVALSLGWVSWQPFALAAVLGLALGVPAGMWTDRHIRQIDPNPPPRHTRRSAAAVV